VIEEFANLLYDSGVLKFGDFKLKSGQHSPFFLNFGNLHTGRQLAALGEALAETIQAGPQPHPDVILGPPYKAISMAAVTVTALWNQHRVNSGFMTFRKESKEHGEGGDFLGHVLRGGESIIMVDDVMTSGQTKIEAMELLKSEAQKAGFEAPVFRAVVVGVDRQETEGDTTAAEAFTEQTGVPVLSVATIRELVDALESRLTEEEKVLIKEYLG
jgi:orotate phosphoribosyltransferase